MNENIREINFGEKKKIKIRAMYQFDKGQVLHIKDAVENSIAELTNGTVKRNKIIVNGQVDIPNVMLESTAEINCYVKVVNESSETTIKQIIIPINPKDNTGEEIPEDDEQSFIEQITEIMNSTKAEAEDVKQRADSGEFNGDDGKSAYQVAVDNGFEGTEAEWLEYIKGQKGDKGDKGDKGEKGEPGTTVYSELSDKPSINGTELSGNKTSGDLGIPNVFGGYGNPSTDASNYTGVKAYDLYIDRRIESPTIDGFAVMGLWFARYVSGNYVSWQQTQRGVFGGQGEPPVNLGSWSNLTGEIREPLKGALYIDQTSGKIYKFKETISSVYKWDTLATTTDVSTAISNALQPIQSQINTVESIAKGATQGLSFYNYQVLVTTFNSKNKQELNVGQNLYINTLEVPDLWVSVNNAVTYKEYTYVSDDQFIEDLVTADEWGLQIGWYYVSRLEGQKVDLTEYVKKSELGETEFDSFDYQLIDVAKDLNEWNLSMSGRLFSKGISLETLEENDWKVEIEADNLSELITKYGSSIYVSIGVSNAEDSIQFTSGPLRGAITSEKINFDIMEAEWILTSYGNYKYLMIGLETTSDWSTYDAIENGVMKFKDYQTVQVKRTLNSLIFDLERATESEEY